MFAYWQRGEHFNIFPNTSQQEKTIKLATENVEGDKSIRHKSTGA
jgi:hypothetical protein